MKLQKLVLLDQEPITTKTMKINWGTGIILAFIGFIGFILYFVISASTDSKYKHDLVSPNYYEEELNYQNEIDWEQNAILDKVVPRITLNTETIDFIFPTQKSVSDSKGYINFYRPSNKVLDLKIPINLKDSIIQISKEKLVEGRYDIKVFWTNNNRNYMYKKSILL